MLESLFDKVANLRQKAFIEKRLQYRCFPVKFVKFLRKPILKNICERNCNTRGVFVSVFQYSGNKQPNHQKPSEMQFQCIFNLLSILLGLTTLDVRAKDLKLFGSF